MNKLVCPEPEIISAFVFGRLEDDDIDRVAAHLEECAECLSAVQTLDEANDTLLSRLEGASAAGSIELPDVCRQALAQAAALVNAGEDEPTTAGRVVPRLGRVGNYELIEELGRGGMGTVYKALHVNLKRLVALKVLPAEKMQDRRAVARFRREMEAVGKLVHPNIVLAHDAGEADGQHFLVMEFVEGLDLAQIADRHGPLAVVDACELVRQAAMGLEHAHQHGLVHRDIKPSNLILSAHGQTKILDLGLALLEAGQPTESDLTGDCQMMGTTDYMAPEQAGDSHAVDIRADIYSLGCTLYKLLVGRAPFSGPQYNSTLKKLMAHAQTRVTPVHEARPDVPLALSAVVERMMAKSAGDRFAAPREVAAALAPFAAGANLPALLERGRQGPIIARGIIETTATASGCTSALEATVEKEADPVKTAPAADSSDAPLVVVGPRPGSQRNRGRPRWLVAAMGAAAVLLLAGIVVIVKTKSGQTKRIELPDDAREIQVENNGKHVGRVSIPDPTKQVATKEKTAIPAGDPGVPDIATRNSAAATIDRRVAEHVLALGGTLDLLYRPPLGKGVSQIGDLPNDAFKITGIDLHGSTLLHSDHVKMIAQLRHLRALNLYGTQITNDDLNFVGKLRTLRTLNIAGTKITDEGLKALQGLTGLTSLSVGGIHLTSRGMRTIGELGQLEELFAGDTGVVDEGLAMLQALKRLRTLELRNARIKDAGLASLASLEGLEVLELGGTHINGAGLRYLAKLPRLDTLNLDGSWIKDEHVHELQAFPALHEVNLRGTRLTDAAIEILSPIKPLTQIDVHDTRITDEGRNRLGEALSMCNLNAKHQEATRKAAAWAIEHGGAVNYLSRIAELPSGPFEITRISFNTGLVVGDVPDELLSQLSNLRSVEMGGHAETAVGARLIAHLGNLPRLQYFISYTDRTISDAEIARFRQCPSLLTLIVSHSRISDAGLAGLRNLQPIDLGLSFTGITDDALESLGKERLRVLTLYDCSAVTDAGLSHIRDALQLETLDLTNTSVTDAGLQYLSELEQLNFLSLRGTRLFGEGLAHLAKLQNLQVLDLAFTRVSDEHLAALTGLDRLSSLNLRNTELSDAGLHYLKLLHDLNVLYLEGTQVSEEGIARLQEALPHCAIFSDFNPEATAASVESAGTEKGGAANAPISANSNVSNATRRTTAVTAPRDISREAARRLAELGAHFEGPAINYSGYIEFELPTEPFTITAISHCEKLTNADFELIAQLEALARLDAAESCLDDHSVGVLTKLKSLERIDLSGTSVGDKGLGVLLANRHASGRIRELKLAGTAVTGDGIKQIGKLQSLETLDLSRTAVTDAGLEALSYHSIRVLAVAGSHITSAGLRSIATLQHLQNLDLSNTRIADGLSSLAAMSNLRVLSLRGVAVHDEALGHLASLSNLDFLDLTQTGVTAPAVARFQKSLPRCRILTDF